MMRPKLIKTEAEHQAALLRLEEIFDAEPGTADGDEAELLTALVEMYEDKAFPIAMPNPVEAIQFRMAQAALKPIDLVPYIGSADKVEGVLSGKCGLTLAMIRNLVAGLGIPAELLLQKKAAHLKHARGMDAVALSERGYSGFHLDGAS